MKSVLQDWVMEIGLRHQGVLLSGLRGCDTVPKHHPTKLITRGLRADCLVSFAGDPNKSVSYIKPVTHKEFVDMLPSLLDSMDELPAHYYSHFMHSVQILAFFHPQVDRQALWNQLYLRICKRLHVNPETIDQLNKRLDAPS